MTHSASDTESPRGPGPASVILGSIGLVLFFLPILGGPLSAVGLLAGLIGLLMCALGGRANLLWSLAGSCIGSLALGLNLALAFAPLTGDAKPPTRSARPPVIDHTHVSPPARQSASFEPGQTHARQ